MLIKAFELCELDFPECQVVAINFVGPGTMAKINYDFVGHQGLTDVITFDYREPQTDLACADVAAELFICFETALCEGRKRSTSYYGREMVLYIVHGLLHLAGEDDLLADARRKMKRREGKIMRELAKHYDFSAIFSEPKQNLMEK